MSSLLIPEGRYSEGSTQDKRQSVRIGQWAMQMYLMVFIF